MICSSISKFARFAPGGGVSKFPEAGCSLKPSSTITLQTSSSLANTRMAAPMDSVITLDNFTSKLSQFDPHSTSQTFYGLVDMGR